MDFRFTQLKELAYDGGEDCLRSYKETIHILFILRGTLQHKI